MTDLSRQPSGFLGWNVCNLSKTTWDIYGTVFSHPLEIDGVHVLRVDLTDYGQLQQLFEQIRPDAVIHTAAAADPNYCQAHKKDAYSINVDASINLAGLCADCKIPFVSTSSDLVFNGLKAPYREEDPVCPINRYGEQKVQAEKGILQRYPEAAVCRMVLMFGRQVPRLKASFSR